MENLALTAAELGSFWRGKRVVVTGHTGFKGAWLTLWLHRLGAKVLGISLPPLTSPNLFAEANIDELCDTRFSDIRDVSALVDLIRGAEPEIVIHLAAQALVRRSYQSPLATFETNLMGTVHVLEALRDLTSPRGGRKRVLERIEDELGHDQADAHGLSGGHVTFAAFDFQGDRTVFADHRVRQRLA
jgi:CDP-glucose 4,6-dehydratase